MVLKKFQSLNIKYLLFFIFLCCKSIKTFSQHETYLDSVFIKIFNSDLIETKTKQLGESTKPIIIVSNLNCSGCVKYFTSNQKKYNIVFVINNESLLEVMRLKSLYKLSNKNLYFTTSEYINFQKKLICENPTPCSICKCKNKTFFLSYDDLSNITKEFSINKNILSKFFKECDFTIFNK